MSCPDCVKGDQLWSGLCPLCYTMKFGQGDLVVAAIVAWLRSDDRTAVRPSKAWDVLNWAADAIERDEWRKGET